MTPRKTTPGPLRVLGYVRVSTQEQTASGAGLTAQRDAITEACRVRDYELLDIIEDGGFSGKSLKRPGMVAALAELDAGRADALMASKLDRLSRSTLDFAGLLERARQCRWTIIALDNGGSDMTTPQGEAMASMSAVFAQLERRLISQRITEALAVKKAEGVQIGRPRSLPADVVARIVAERAQPDAKGRPVAFQAIADGLNRDGVPTAQGGRLWRPSSVQAVLRSVEREHERAERLSGR